MDAREYLGEIAIWQRRIDELRAEIDEVRRSINLLPGVSYDGDKIQTTATDSAVLRAVEELTDKEHRLAEMISRYHSERAERIMAITAVKNESQREVLYDRYLHLQYWWEIAQEQGLSERRVYQIHEEGIKEMQRLIDEEEL